MLQSRGGRRGWAERRMLVRMADPTNGEQVVDRSAVADYVATMTADLAAMAREHGLTLLGQLLEMARLEAEGQRHQPDPPDPPQVS